MMNIAAVKCSLNNACVAVASASEMEGKEICGLTTALLLKKIDRLKAQIETSLVIAVVYSRTFHL